MTNQLKYWIAITILLVAINCNAQKHESSKSAIIPTVTNDAYRAIAQFYEYDSTVDLAVKTIFKNDITYGFQEKFVFTGSNNSRVPGYLVLPKNQQIKHPLICIVDGLYGSKDRWFENSSWPHGGMVTKALLEKGFAVLIIDAVNHGERVALNDYVSPSLEIPSVARDMIMQTALDYRKAIDYASTRNDIDSSRIGMMGLSMGGLITFQISAVDTRIKTAIAGVTPVITDVRFQPVAATTFAGHIQSNSFLMFAGAQDTWYTIEQARAIYDTIMLKNKEFVLYETGHQPPVAYIDLVTKWFVAHL